MSTGRRLGIFYALVFAGAGASLPYLPVWLKSEGLDGAGIGAILAAPLLARVFTGPLLAVWADGFRERRTPLAILAGAGTLAYAGLGLVDGFWAMAACWFVGGTAFAAIIPLTDVLTLRLARRERFTFGRSRAWGSVAFIVANLALGAALTRGPPWMVLVWVTIAAALTATLARLLLPAEPIHEDGASGGRLQGLGRLFRNGPFLLAITSVGLIQAAHGFHYGFSTLVWRGQGISPAVAGVLWALGVLAEIAFLSLAEPWRKRLGPERLLILCGAAAVLRWTVAGMAPPLAVLAPLHLLHGLTFAGVFIAGLSLVERTSPAES
ncbi:MAG: MFS transporter, partial [Pseudomonadota bacterium]|nr:MFS transporter [Pseudomonadota bacterium]